MEIDQQHLDQLVRESTRELEEFSRSVSHDLRAPLRAIIGFSQALIEDHEQQLDAVGQDFVQRIHEAGLQMSQMMDDMAALSSLNRNPPKQHLFSLSELAHQLICELRVDPKYQQRHFHCQVSDDLLIRSDPGLLRLILQNLLSNAFKFTAYAKRAEIEVGAKSEGTGTHLWVRDNGIGFDENLIDRLYKPYQRLHVGQQYAGNGIGLASVYRAASCLGGKVWAESPQKTGATFHVWLPITLLNDDWVEAEAEAKQA